jgi:hypothetical protein
MNRFVARRSLLFFIATGLIAVGLFADGINLDDLLPGSYVVHDDDDNPFGAGYSASPVLPAAPAARHQIPCQHQGNPQSKDSHSSHVLLQIVFDQDSPSLASDPLAIQVTDPMFLSDRQQIAAHQFSSGTPLHLLIRVLLI